MKTIYAFALIAALISVNSFASQGEEVGLPDDQCTASAPSLDSMTEEDAATNNLRNYGVWHCVAYPNGGGHWHGHEAYDHIYSYAYYRALRACQYYHRYCHVHCHFDHIH